MEAIGSLRNLLSTRRQGYSGIEAVAGTIEYSKIKDSGSGDVGEKKVQMEHGPGQEEPWWDGHGSEQRP